jgi:hypothetical protein
MPLENDNLARFVALEKRRREIEGELDAIKEEARQLEEWLLDEWADRGQQNASVDGLTVYVAVEFYCNKVPGVETPEICRRLEAAGLGDLVAPAYNAARLKSWVKESIDEGRPLPQDLAECLKFDSVPRLRSRRK